MDFRKYLKNITSSKAFQIIFLVGIVTYTNTLFNNFVWDDITLIINNPSLHFLDFSVLLGKNQYNIGLIYRPFQPLYFALIYALFNNTPFFYHVLEILLHIINALLVFALLKNFLNKNIALFLSLVFIIHPIQVESVAFISATGNEFFFLFGITALLISIKQKLNLRKIILIFGLVLLSILTRETGFIFLFLILIYRFIFKQDKKFIFFFSSLIFGFCYLFVRIVMMGNNFERFQTNIPIASISIKERLLNIPSIIFYYIKTFFFPYTLAINQQWVISGVNFFEFYFPLFVDCLLFFAISIFGVYVYKKHNKLFPLLSFFFLWFLSGLFMHMQIFPLNMTVADRWFYLTIVGLLGVIGIGLEVINIKSKNVFNLGVILSVFILIIFSLRTIIRNNDWYSEIILISHDLKVYPDNSEMQSYLASDYFDIKNYDKALTHFEYSLKILPSEKTLFNIGATYQEMGKIQEAKKYYYKSLSTNLFPPKQHRNIEMFVYERLAAISIATDSKENAQKFIKDAVTKFPNSSNLWVDLAIVEYKIGNQEEALLAADKARKILSSQSTENLYILIQNKQFQLPN